MTGDRIRDVAAARGSRLVPAQPVVAHIHLLRAAGAKRGQIAAVAGIHPAALSVFLSRPPTSTSKTFAAALFAVTLPAALAAPLGHRVPARGARRRLQALYAHGWSFQEQARHASIGIAQLQHLRDSRRRFIDREVDEAIRELHRELWNVTPPTTSPRDRRAIEARRRRARRLGYAPSLAWDDIDRDEAPPEAPADEDDVDDVAVALAAAGADVQLSAAEQARLLQLHPPRRRTARRVA